MSFLYPSFLIGLFALVIPIIIHLFNFKRYKKVAFSNVKFLQEIKERTQAQSQLKHLLILLMRLLAITFLVFAFAQPFIIDESKKNIAGNNSVSIFIDNSFSTNGVGTEGNLFETGRQYAYKIAEAYGQSDNFQVIDHSFLPEHQRFYSKESIVNSIDNIEITPASRTFIDVFQRQKELLEEDENQVIYQIIDGQSTYFNNLTTFNLDTTSINFVVLSPENQGNVLIDSCWFESPVRSLEKPELLKVRLKNMGTEDRKGIPVKLNINGLQKSIVNTDIPANSSTTIEIGYTLNSTGNIFGEIQIDDYPITFDDQFFFHYTIKPEITIVAISPSDTSKYFHSLYKTDDYFKLKQYTIGSINYNNLGKANLLILNGVETLPSALVLAIDDLLKKGSNICFIPSVSNNEISSSLTNSLHLPQFDNVISQKANISALNFEHPLFEDVFEEKQTNIDLPSVSRYFPVNTSQLGFETIMNLDNGAPFLLESKFEKGEIFAFTTPFKDSTTNFIKHALFVPTFFQMALKVGSSSKLFYSLENEPQIALNDLVISNEEVIHIKSLKEEIDIIPEIVRKPQNVALKIYDQINTAGHFEILLGKNVIGGLALNYNRKESSNKFLSTEEIETLLKEKGFQNIRFIEESLSDVSKSLTQEANGNQLWQLCLLLSLLFFGFEMALLRFLK